MFGQLLGLVGYVLGQVGSLAALCDVGPGTLSLILDEESLMYCPVGAFYNLHFFGLGLI